MAYTIESLDASTWDAFAELVLRNNGIFGGCWCIGYHPEPGQQALSHRAAKEARVRTGRAHAALVLDQDGVAQGWCQYGSPEELANIAVRASRARRWKALSTRSRRPVVAWSRPSPR